MYFNIYFVILIIFQQFYLTKQCFNIIPMVLYFLKTPEKNFVHYDRVNYMQEKLIRMSIDESIDPCEDFYGYACNKYQQQNMDTNYDEITGLVDYKLNRILIDLMETKFQMDFEIDFQVPNQKQPIIEKTKIYYKSCLREQRKKRNVTKYFEVIKPAKNANWPILEEAKREEISQDSSLYQWPDYVNFDFLDLLGELQSYGLKNVLISQEIIQNEDGSYNIKIEPAFTDEGTTLPEESVLRILLMGLGLNNPQKLDKYVKQLQMIDKEFQDIMQTFAKTQEEKEILYQNLDPQLKLTNFLKHLIPERVKNHSSITIKNPNYFKYLNNREWQSTEKQSICNYLMLKFLFYVARDGTTEFTALECIQDLRNKMDLSVNYIYYDNIYKYQADENNYKIMNITHKILETAEDFFVENNLDLSEQQIEKLSEKLFNIQTNIGNLPENVNLRKIEEFYKNVPDLAINNYYKNHLLLLRHRFDKSIIYSQNETFFIASDNRFGSSSSPVYITQQNMIIIPFGSLQFPLFHYNYHPLFRWSLMGFILAHEFTHAFDTLGLNFDSKGLPSTSLSQILNNANFNSSLECMQSQLSTDAIDERIADFFGVHIAYRVYENYFDLQPPFLHRHWKKMFFLNLSQFFCGKKNIQFIDHDSDPVRLQQIAMNSDDFSDAFHCPEGSKMNPIVKCRLY